LGTKFTRIQEQKLQKSIKKITIIWEKKSGNKKYKKYRDRGTKKKETRLA
jgi:hypothetical protein